MLVTNKHVVAHLQDVAKVSYGVTTKKELKCWTSCFTLAGGGVLLSEVGMTALSLRSSSIESQKPSFSICRTHHAWLCNTRLPCLNLGVWGDYIPLFLRASLSWASRQQAVTFSKAVCSTALRSRRCAG